MDIEKFGKVKIGKIKSPNDLKKLLPKTILEAETYIIKPNWFSPHPGNFTDKEILRLLGQVLEGKIIIIESYTLEKQDGRLKFFVDNEYVDWEWVMKHPNWDWIKEGGKWRELRDLDQWFLSKYGFKDLFSEFGIEYINVTEEIWCNRHLNPDIVKKTVEKKYHPVHEEKFYSFFPKRLEQYKKSVFIDLGKVKGINGTYPSLSLKNMFGLIPDPLRSWWHGLNDSLLSRNIIDMNKLYAAFFDIHGLCEAINSAIISNPKGKIKTPWGNYDIIKDLDFLSYSNHLISLDAILCGLINVDPSKVSYITLGEEVFGSYDRNSFNRAKKASKQWFPV